MPPRRPLRDRLPGLARHEPLPSLYDRHPKAGTAFRRPRGLQVVEIDRIVGTLRHPSQNTDDFLPLPYLRGKNWSGRWQRIRQATRDLSVLPAIEVVQVGDEYYVADGHNRVAAALENGAVAIDADVTELIMPGAAASPEPPAPQRDAAFTLAGSDELRQAAAGGQSRTTLRRSTIDRLRREDLAHDGGVVGKEPHQPDETT